VTKRRKKGEEAEGVEKKKSMGVVCGLLIEKGRRAATFFLY